MCGESHAPQERPGSLPAPFRAPWGAQAQKRAWALILGPGPSTLLGPGRPAARDSGLGRGRVKSRASRLSANLPPAPPPQPRPEQREAPPPRLPIGQINRINPSRGCHVNWGEGKKKKNGPRAPISAAGVLFAAVYTGLTLNEFSCFSVAPCPGHATLSLWGQKHGSPSISTILQDSTTATSSMAEPNTASVNCASRTPAA